MVQSNLIVPGRYDRLEEITRFIARAARAAGLNDRATYHCQVAVDEACTNIIMHGYGGQDRGEISVTCQAEPGVLTILLEDNSQPFDPGSIRQPDLSGPVEELSVGGLGVHLMRQMMDEVRFLPGPDRNRVILVKRDSPHDR